MAAAVKRQRVSAAVVKKALPATRKSGRLDNFAKVTKAVTTAKSVADKKEQAAVTVPPPLEQAPVSPRKRKQEEVEIEETETTEESAALLTAALKSGDQDKTNRPPSVRRSSPQKVPRTPRKASLHSSVETPTKGATNLLDQLRLTKPITTSLPKATGSKADLDSEAVEPGKPASTFLPVELIDLINLHASFLTALSLFYAHNGTSSPADLQELCPDITRVWGKRRVTLEDVRRTLGVMNLENKNHEREDPSRRLSLSDYGDGKRCVEIGAESDSVNTFGRPLNEKLLNARFEDSLKALWQSWESKLEPSKFIQSLPLEPITIYETLAKLSSIQTIGQRRLDELKAGLKQQKEAAQEKKAEKHKENVAGRPTLLERLRAKQLQKANLPPPPTKQELERKAALHRIEEVAAILGVLSTSSSIGQQRISFTMPTVISKLQDSFKGPISKPEAESCIKLLASEIAPTWTKMAKMGKVDCLVVLRDNRPSEEDLREKIKLVS